MAQKHPTQIGRYKIQEELGRGGFGRVYRAYDPTVGRPVAIKILTDVSADTQTRFRNEATVAGNLRHKNIVTVYEYGTYEGLPFLAMEYMEGEDLHHAITSQKPLSLLEKCTIMSQVADGLCYAHNCGVVHRDMKPANIMVLRDGAVKIMDFGIARLTRTPDATRLTQQGYLIGTLRYMAPELLAGSDFDARCDIFAYGVIFYELVTGVHPFDAPDARRLMYRLTFEEPAPIREYVPDIPDALPHTISRMIHKDRDRRYRNLKELQFDTEPVRLRLQTDRASELVLQAGELVSTERLEPAQQVLQEALALEPSNSVARGLWERLQRQLQQRTLQPQIDASLKAGEEHMEQRRFAEAVQFFESAHALDRNNLYIQGRLEEARALVEHTSIASQLVAEARREFEQRNLTAAYRNVSEALRHDPENPEAAEFLKTIQSHVERRQAEQRVDDAIRRAQGLMLMPAYDEAIGVLTASDPESPKIQEWLDRVRNEKNAHERKQMLHREMDIATDLLRDERLDEAAKRLENLQGEFPDNQDVAHLLAYAQKEQAARARTKAIDSAAAKVRSLMESNDFEGALATLDSEIRKYPNESLLVRLLASTMSAKGAWERQRAVQSALANCESLRSQQRLAEAIQTAKAVLEKHSAEPALLDLLKSLETDLSRQHRDEEVRNVRKQAEALLGQSQPESALEALQSALAQYPGDADLEEILKRVQAEVLARQKARAAERAAAIDQREQEARTRAANEDFDGALALLADGLRNWPDAPSLLELRKSTLAEQQRCVKRRRALQELEEVRRVALHESDVSAAAEALPLAVSIASEWAQDEEIQSVSAGIVSLLTELGSARQHLAEGNLQAVLEICERHLAQYPNHPAFREIKRDAERGYRRSFLVELRRRAASEQDLRLRARIFEKGLERYPDEAAVAHELRFIRNKLALVDTIVEQARACERSGRVDEALEKWNSIFMVYDRYPGLKAEIDRVERARKKALSEALEREAQQVGQALDTCDLDTAAELLHQVLADHPDALKAQAEREGVSLPSPARKAATANVAPTLAESPERFRGLIPSHLRRPLLVGAVAVSLTGAGIAVHFRKPREIAVTVASNVPGTTVSVGGQRCVTPNCLLKLMPGTYTVQGATAGYQSVERQFNLAPGKDAFQMELALKNLPEVLQVNTNFESGKVYLDGHFEAELRDGQYTTSGVAPGRHTIRVTGASEFQAEWMSFAGASPQVLHLTSGTDLQATLVANAGETGSVHCNCDTKQVTVDGAPGVTATSSAGSVALKGLKEGARQIALQARSLIVDIRSNPALNIFLALDRNVGMLTVETREDGVKVFLNNRPYQRTTERGMIRIPVNAGEYAVRVEKAGFLPSPPQMLALKKGEEKALTFALSRAFAHLEIAGCAASAQVRLDGQLIGETDRNGILRRDVTPGTHTIELSKDDYTPIRISEQFNPGKTLRLDGRHVAMAKATKSAPPDARQLEAQDWAQVANSTNPGDFESFLRNHPGSTNLEQARARLGELRQQLRSSAASQLEQTTWESVDQNNRAQLQDYLSRYPVGIHAQEAHTKIAEADRQATEALASQRLREQKDQEQARNAADVQAVARVLMEFDAAYNRKDLTSLQRLWNALPVTSYRQQFRDSKDLKFQLQLIGQPTVNGNSATALCTRTLSYRGQSGGLHTYSGRANVTLSRESSGWLIRSIDIVP